MTNRDDHELINRAEAWLRRLRPSDMGANGPMFTRLLLEALKRNLNAGTDRRE